MDSPEGLGPSGLGQNRGSMEQAKKPQVRTQYTMLRS